MRIFYGWWIVTACLLSALVGNALGLFARAHFRRIPACSSASPKAHANVLY
jgi:hypothetical protein